MRQRTQSRSASTGRTCERAADCSPNHRPHAPNRPFLSAPFSYQLERFQFPRPLSGEGEGEGPGVAQLSNAPHNPNPQRRARLASRHPEIKGSPLHSVYLFRFKVFASF